MCDQPEEWTEDCPFLQPVAFRLHSCTIKLHAKFFFHITAIQEKAQRVKISTDMLY